MAFTLQVPSEYGYVLAIAVATGPLGYWHGFRASQLRKRAGVDYPNILATAAEAEKNPVAKKYNCAQRAHANYLELLPPFLSALLVAGLRYPLAATGVGAAWLVSRVVYQIGYTSDVGPKGRTNGFIGQCLSYLGVFGMAVTSIYKLIAEQ